MSKDKLAKSYLVAVAAPSSIDGFFRPARLGALFLRARVSHSLLQQTAARAIQLCGESERERPSMHSNTSSVQQKFKAEDFFLSETWKRNETCTFVQLLKELLNKFYAFFNALGIGFHSFLVHRKFFSFPWK